MTRVKLVSSVNEWDSIVQTTTGLNGKPVIQLLIFKSILIICN